MWCAKCQQDLANCTCPDIEERLAEIAESPYIIYRACLKCRKHYARCKCEEPEWGTSEQLRKEKLMGQDAIRELMQVDLEAAGLNSNDYFKEKKHAGLKSPPLWYCKDCLKEYRYKGALENHIYSVHRPKDKKGYASWAEVLKRIGSINDPRRPRRISRHYEVSK